jgi:hypothetical protein
MRRQKHGADDSYKPHCHGIIIRPPVTIGIVY